MLPIFGESSWRPNFGVKLRRWLVTLVAVLTTGIWCAASEKPAQPDPFTENGRDANPVPSKTKPPQKAAPPKLRGGGRHQHTNRLARETSPYLLLHAHNPVDWYPWSPEVFETAKRAGKPIFLSIGYSSCHWCHVMERLVFENEEIARTMNEKFISVKVDREERPDVDDVYMTALLVYAQATGSGEGGGWPLSMFLTPEGKPFAGGTYFPPNDIEGRTGFPTVLARVSELWRDKRDSLEKNAAALSDEVRRVMRTGLSLTPVKFDRTLAAMTSKSLIESGDPEFGGVDFDRQTPNAPKFPVPAKLALLEYEARRLKNNEATALLTLTLDHMAAGGIRDHVGGGFHRYSTDRRWHVPHFEKMLYDEAQLAELYAEAHHRTGNRLYRQVAEEIFGFVLDEMSDPSGGFISALDADSEGLEGIYYVWSIPEIDTSLGPDDSRLFKRVYGFNEPKEFERGYIVRLAAPIDSIAREMRVSSGALETRLDGLRRQLLARRQQRRPVPRDDKVLTAWNGLMIRALARGGGLLERKDYVQSAEKAATFLLERMRDDHNNLLRSYRAGQARIPAYLEDYAYLTDGLLALYKTTHNEKWLRSAKSLCDDQIRLFWDDESKGFYFTSRNHEALIARTRNAFDAVLPSGNAVSVRNLIRLSALTREPRYRELARETLEAFAPALAKAPRSMPHLALALYEYFDDAEAGESQSVAEPEVPSEEKIIIQTGGQESASKGSAGANKSDSPVSIKAYLSVDKLPPGGTCEILLFVKIEEGWHINTDSPPHDWLSPTKLSVSSKVGTRLTRIRYAKGKMARVFGSDDPVPVYAKETVIHGTFSVPTAAAGNTEEFTIQLKYQACNANACRPPATAKLVGKIQVARDSRSVKQINQNLFPKTRD